MKKSRSEKPSPSKKESASHCGNRGERAARRPTPLSVRVIPMDDPRPLDMTLDMLLTEFIRQEISRGEKEI